MESNDRAEGSELLQKVKNGDDNAVTELYNTYVDRIYSLIYNHVNRDRETAQEILQETFFAAIKSAGGFRGKSKVYTWLCSIASKKIADFYRRKKRESKYRDEYAIDFEEIRDTVKSMNELLESKEASNDIRQKIYSLPLHYRQVLLLKYIEGLKISEISEIMERSPKSVEGLLTRARKELQGKLENIV